MNPVGLCVRARVHGSVSGDEEKGWQETERIRSLRRRSAQGHGRSTGQLFDEPP